MGRVNTPQLSELQREELELLVNTSSNASFRKRCQLILLKAYNNSSCVLSPLSYCPNRISSYLLLLFCMPKKVGKKGHLRQCFRPQAHANLAGARGLRTHTALRDRSE
jgi:hypothetical protein